MSVQAMKPDCAFFMVFSERKRWCLPMKGPGHFLCLGVFVGEASADDSQQDLQHTIRVQLCHGEKEMRTGV